jgi:hypothetical protein
LSTAAGKGTGGTRHVPHLDVILDGVDTLDEIDFLLNGLKKVAGSEPPRLATDKTQSSRISAH